MTALAAVFFSITKPADFSDVALLSFAGLLGSVLLSHFGVDLGSTLSSG
jgi:uncharacterized membrane protein YjjB (DUF3815 family)